MTMLGRLFLAARPLLKYHMRDYAGIVKVVAVGAFMRARREERVGGEQRAS
jgi:hypothetical protein